MRSPAARRTLARSYEDDGIELDNADRAKLEMLDSYMSSAAEAGDADAAEPDAALAMPTRPEDVDKFMDGRNKIMLDDENAVAELLRAQQGVYTRQKCWQLCVPVAKGLAVAVAETFTSPPPLILHNVA